MDYTKMESDTWLKINVDVQIHISVPNSHDPEQNLCATWYIKVTKISYLLVHIIFYRYTRNHEILTQDSHSHVRSDRVIKI